MNGDTGGESGASGATGASGASGDTSYGGSTGAPDSGGEGSASGTYTESYPESDQETYVEESPQSNQEAVDSFNAGVDSWTGESDYQDQCVDRVPTNELMPTDELNPAGEGVDSQSPEHAIGGEVAPDQYQTGRETEQCEAKPDVYTGQESRSRESGKDKDHSPEAKESDKDHTPEVKEPGDEYTPEVKEPGDTESKSEPESDEHSRPPGSPSTDARQTIPSEVSKGIQDASTKSDISEKTKFTTKFTSDANFPWNNQAAEQCVAVDKSKKPETPEKTASPDKSAEKSYYYPWNEKTAEQCVHQPEQQEKKPGQQDKTKGLQIPDNILGKSVTVKLPDGTSITIDATKADGNTDVLSITTLKNMKLDDKGFGDKIVISHTDGFKIEFNEGINTQILDRELKKPEKPLVEQKKPTEFTSDTLPRVYDKTHSPLKDKPLTEEQKQWQQTKQKMADYLKEKGYDLNKDRFESQWLGILQWEFNVSEWDLRSEPLRQKFTKQELGKIQEYVARVGHDIFKRTVYSPMGAITEPNERAIPDAVMRRRCQQWLDGYENILHMWDIIAALGGAVVGGAALVRGRGRSFQQRVWVNTRRESGKYHQEGSHWHDKVEQEKERAPHWRKMDIEDAKEQGFKEARTDPRIHYREVKERERTFRHDYINGTREAMFGKPANPKELHEQVDVYHKVKGAFIRFKGAVGEKGERGRKFDFLDMTEPDSLKVIEVMKPEPSRREISRKEEQLSVWEQSEEEAEWLKDSGEGGDGKVYVKLKSGDFVDVSDAEYIEFAQW